jgi:hypothetical protein
VVPGKLLAFRGPRDLPGDAEYEDVLRPDGSYSHRDFAPAHYAHILPQFGVQVISINNTTGVQPISTNKTTGAQATANDFKGVRAISILVNAR